MKERQKAKLNHFIFLNVYKVIFFFFFFFFFWSNQPNLFSHDFFLQIRPGRAKYGWFDQFKPDYQFSTR